MTSRTVRSRSLAAILGTLALFVLAGCTETNTEYVERPQFNPPPDSVSGFMGYYDASTQQTTCGNCHVSVQGLWFETAHAGAYDAVFTSGYAEASCYGCNTVNGRGNTESASGEPSGYSQVADPAYHDVQCESCHGPGFDHVSSPSNDNHPLARAGLKDTAASCGGCHSGSHSPYVEQWTLTGHADSATSASPAGNGTGCGAACHEGRTALARMNGNRSTYIELDSIGETTTLPPATCAVCHDPHGSPYSKQLRMPIDIPETAANLCMSCHNRGASPPSNFSNSTATVTKRGAHASQGPVLVGQGAGYIPQNFIYDSNAAYTTHASTKNPRLCAGCHVNRQTVTDPVTGGFQFQSVGHLFSPNPCLDASGLPVKDNSCAYQPASTRFWGEVGVSGCVNSGCHASADVAASALVNERSTIASLADQLWRDDVPTLNTGGFPYMEAGDAGYLVYLLFTAGNPYSYYTNASGNPDSVRAFNANDNVVSPAEGALFNALMLAEDLYSHNDGSYGVHNPFYYEALLSASIAEVQTVYGAYLPAPPSPTVKALMDKALSRPGFAYRSTGQEKLSSAR